MARTFWLAKCEIASSVGTMAAGQADSVDAGDYAAAGAPRDAAPAARAGRQTFSRMLVRTNAVQKIL